MAAPDIDPRRMSGARKAWGASNTGQRRRRTRPLVSHDRLVGIGVGGVRLGGRGVRGLVRWRRCRSRSLAAGSLSLRVEPRPWEDGLRGLRLVGGDLSATGAAFGLGVTPSAASGVGHLEDVKPPAASILALADAVNASATTNSGVEISPAPRIFIGLLSVRTSPTARRMSWLMVTGADFDAFLASPSSSNAPASASAPIAPMLTTSYSTLKRFLKPRSFGIRRWRGVWPPSNHGGMEPPARAFWPLVPRPASLPLPAAMPSRRSRLAEPSAGWRSWVSYLLSDSLRTWRRRSPRR